MSTIGHDEIARLAYLNWEKDGSPRGHDQKYWLEAEQQIKATGHLLICEINPPANQSSVGAKSDSNGKRKKQRQAQPEQTFSRS